MIRSQSFFTLQLLALVLDFSASFSSKLLDLVELFAVARFKLGNCFLFFLQDIFKLVALFLVPAVY